MKFNEAVSINPRTRLLRGNTYPFIDMAAVNPELRYVSSANQRAYSGSGARFQAGDTLMARITPCLENGKIAQYAKSNRSKIGYASTEFIVLRGRPDVTESDFVYYLAKWDAVRRYAISQMTGTSGRQRVPVESLNHLEIDIPSLSEQRAIVDILGAFDDKIELNRRMNETLEAMARAIFDDWFVDFGPVRAEMRGQKSGLPKTLSRLFPGKLAESQIGPIPEGWKISRMDDIFEISNGKTLPVDMRYNDRTYRAFGANGPICTTEKSSVDSACVILGKIGSCGALHRSPLPCWVTNNAFAIREGQTGSLEYVWHTLKRIDFSKYVGGSGNPYMPLQNFGHHLVLLPPYSVCSAYQEIAGNLRERIDCNDFQSDILSAIRDALLLGLMSGRIPVSNFR